jgi:ATP-dependent RNA helicase DDX10/DBP4
MGFEKSLNAILENIPRQGRQTLLFSATQTKSVKELVRLNLTVFHFSFFSHFQDPEYVSVHEHAAAPTPDTLRQQIVFIELFEKLSYLFGFLKANRRKKIIVFFSTCKMVPST